MPRLKIDQREIEVAPGATVLQAARTLGIDIPTLCYLEGCRPSTSCLVCMVKVGNGSRLVPSCATLAEDGMEVESETEEVRQVRKAALELLLSDHLGDCLAPCQFACPAHMDVPTMLRQIAEGNLREAIVTIKRDIALPAVLGRICPKPCEKGCRRNATDSPVAVCQLKRFAADADLASGQPYVPQCEPASGKRVGIVGAGPTGLAAAYFLAQKGHACTLLHDQEKPGGRLRHECGEEELPRAVLEAEIAALLGVGIGLRSNTRVGGANSLADLQAQFDAVLIACGATAKDQARSWDLRSSARGIAVDRETYQTEMAGVFAAGNAIRTKGLAVRSAADGKEAARAIDQYLRAQPLIGAGKPFSTRIGRVEAGELAELVRCAGGWPRQDPAGGLAAGFTAGEASRQAARCLHCDCRGRESCKLRYYAAKYGADPGRYPGPRRRFQQNSQHSEVIYEPGKCIDCGLCIQIASAAGEPLGLTFVGRGFDVRVGVPFDRSLDEALRKVAVQCAAACPTAALALKEKPAAGGLPILGQP